MTHFIRKIGGRKSWATFDGLGPLGLIGYDHKKPTAPHFCPAFPNETGPSAAEALNADSRLEMKINGK